jgi:hypothetical protein
MEFLGTAVKLNGAELQTPKMENASSAPLNPVEGQFYFDSIAKIPYFFDGGQWVSFGSSNQINSFITNVSAWMSSGDMYYADVVHNLNSKDIHTEIYLFSSGATVGVEDLERITSNALRVWVKTNTDTLRIVIFKNQVKVTHSQTITTWEGTPGNYYKDIIHSFETKDIAVQAYETLSGRTVGLDEIIRIDNDTVRLYSFSELPEIRVNVSKL